MRPVLAVSVVGALCFLGTAFDPALEMWAPLIVLSVPLLVFTMWPVDEAASTEPTQSTGKSAGV
jgi:hypothetical protein